MDNSGALQFLVDNPNLELQRGPITDVTIDGLSTADIRDKFDEDWWFGLTGVHPTRKIYPHFNREVLMLGYVLKNPQRVLDICCGPNPASNFLFDLAQPPQHRTLVDLKKQVHRLSSKLKDNPTTVHFDLREINNSQAENYTEFARKVLTERWNLIIATNALNYINYPNAIHHLSSTQKTGDLFYVTNHQVCGYSEFFYNQVPQPMPGEIVGCFEGEGYKLVRRMGEDLCHILVEKQ